MAEISIIFPVHNEEGILMEHTRMVLAYLEQDTSIDDFEILLCPNGCIDHTEEISYQLAAMDPRIRSFPKPQRGIGVGLKEGINHCRYEYGMFYAIDLPFGFEIITHSLLEIQQNNMDLVIGSKAHPDSILKRTFQRKLFSAVLNMLLNIFFRLNVGDPQGSLLWRQSCMQRVSLLLTSDTAFLETQIAIYFRALEFSIKEIPITLKKEFRSTRIPILKESTRILKEICAEKQMMKSKLL